MNDIEKIRQEIERRKELLTPHKGQGVILCREIIKQFDSLLSFIDTISQPIMKDDIIDEIRGEIERRFSEYNHDSNHHIQAAECASILAFIDSLPEEDLYAEVGDTEEDYIKRSMVKVNECRKMICKDSLQVQETCKENQDSFTDEPKELEEAAEEYEDWVESYSQADFPTCVSFKQAFIAGAEWGIKSQEKKIADAYEKGKQEGIRIVRSWESSPGQGGY